MNNTTKLRLTIARGCYVTAYFPDEELNRELFWILTKDGPTKEEIQEIIEFMYRRRLRQQIRIVRRDLFDTAPRYDDSPSPG